MQTRLPSKALRLLWAFDFDGVVCHSAKELCLTAWTAARTFWPEQTAGWPDRPAPPLLQQFYEVRPVVETGWEVMVINRALQEGQYDTPTILRHYTASLRDKLLREYGGHAPEEYMQVFRDVRNEWMTRDEAGWLGENDFYPGAVDCMRHLLESYSSSSPSAPSAASSSSSSPTTSSGSGSGTQEGAAPPPVYVITTKGKEFTLKLLEGAGLGDRLPESHVFGLGSGKKVDVLKALLEEHTRRHNGGGGGGGGGEGGAAAVDTRVVFIEDRLQTLLGVLDHHDPYVRDRADLLLAGWGYNTAAERAQAEAHPAIRHLPKEDDFLAYIKQRQQEEGAARQA